MVCFPSRLLGLFRNHFGATFFGLRDKERETAQISVSTASLGSSMSSNLCVSRGLCATNLAPQCDLKLLIIKENMSGAAGED